MRESDVEHSLLRLLSPELFEAFITAEIGRRSFKYYLATTPEGSRRLDLWWDLQVLQDLARQVRLATLGVRDVYLLSDAEKKVALTPEQLEESLAVLRSTMVGRIPETTSSELLGSLYANEFKVSLHYPGQVVKHS